MGLYTEQLDTFRRQIEEAIGACFPAAGAEHQPVAEAMRYACEDGGKRLRPVLLLEFCRMCGGDPQAALPFACALEMVHSYSLVHDDLPCMDNSPLRRGKPSVHAVYGEAMGLLTGDALLNAAFETMLSPKNRSSLSAEAVLGAAGVLADAAGITGMIGGQVMDLNGEGKALTLAELQLLQEGKTARLIMAACEMGCLLAEGSEDQRKAAVEFGLQLGLCFQIVDDILDVTADPQMLGKPTGGDDRLQKGTYVSLLGLEKARELAVERTERALSALAVFGAEAAALCQLTEALLTRES